MRDISHKVNSLRVATVEAVLTLSSNSLERIRQRQIPKGDPLEIARVAAIAAAKNTSQIIPFCHQVPLDHVAVEFELGETSIRIQSTVKAVHKTGVEMEALVAASTAALTLYDMLKMLDDGMEIVGVKLIRKQGGKSDLTAKLDRPLRAVVIVVSDSCAVGTKNDLSGKLIVERLRDDGINATDCLIIPDDVDQIVATLTTCADRENVDLVLTTGGTGLGSRDVTPEATARVIEKETPGIAESIRAFGAERTPLAALSRGKAGIRGRCLIVNLPGSARAVTESLDALVPLLRHAFLMMWDEAGVHDDPRGEQKT